MFKRDIDWEEQTWDSLAEEFQGPVYGTYAQFQQAVYGSGDFPLAEEYLHLHIPSEQWMGMDKEQRSRHLERVFCAKEVAAMTPQGAVLLCLSLGIAILSLQGSQIPLTCIHVKRNV